MIIGQAQGWLAHYFKNAKREPLFGFPLGNVVFLFSQRQLCDDGPVPLNIRILEIIQQLLAFSNELHEALLR